jgi:membrane protease YdiL (CAAX protease family)
LTSRSAIAVTISILALPGLLNGLYLPALFQLGPAFFWAADAAHYVVVPLVLLVVLAKHGVCPKHYGFTSLPSLNHFEKVMLVVGVTAVFLLAYLPVRSIAEEYFDDHVSSFGYGAALPDGGWLRVTAVVYIAATAAFVEETAFRGLPWRYIKQHTPLTTLIYIVASSAAFAVIHFEQGPANLLASFSLGLASAILYSRIQNLWPLVGAHFAADLWFYR